MKYALIVDNKVVQISYPYVEGYIEVDDNVFADMIKKPDGSCFCSTDLIRLIIFAGLKWVFLISSTGALNPSLNLKYLDFGE